MSDADVHFYFDPVCPFAWITSRWITKVAAQRDLTVDWRAISLWIVNRAKDYERDFPAGYVHGHTAGLRLLRVAAKVRTDAGPEKVGDFYTACGATIFDRWPPEDKQWTGSAAHVNEVIALAGLGEVDGLAAAADDESWDATIEASTEEALGMTGRDVGTPIVAFPKSGDAAAFFGPVISRVPSDEESLALWDSVVHLATFPGFTELKRSLRERPQLRQRGVDVDTAELGATETS